MSGERPGALRAGVRLALDWGGARIGVAACDRDGVLAYPVETITPASDEAHVLRRLTALVDEYEPFEVVVGLPRHLRGVEGASAAAARGHAEWLAERFPHVGVRLVDERLTTVSAGRALRESGRSARTAKAVIDQAAAVAILTHALEVERNTGSAPGEPVNGRTDA